MGIQLCFSIFMIRNHRRNAKFFRYLEGDARHQNTVLTKLTVSLNKLTKELKNEKTNSRM